MIESPIRKFCESSRRKLIVVIVTAATGLLVLIPLVDEYFDARDKYTALADELDNARHTARALPELEEHVVQITGKLTEMEGRTVTARTVSRYRSQLVELIRDADCRVRRFDVSLPALRPWHQNDDPRRQAVPQTGAIAEKTPFALERRSVTLLVDGTIDNVQNLLEQLHKDKTFAYPSRVDLHTNGQRGSSVTLEMEMWLFALERQTAT